MALAEAHLEAVFNKPGFPVVDHFTYVLCGEGCLEEGIGYEACSFAGTQKLGKLILFYDKNNITIEGGIDSAFAPVGNYLQFGYRVRLARTEHSGRARRAARCGKSGKDKGVLRLELCAF